MEGAKVNDADGKHTFSVLLTHIAIYYRETLRHYFNTHTDLYFYLQKHIKLLNHEELNKSKHRTESVTGYGWLL